jgi:hypothetical protein
LFYFLSNLLSISYCLGGSFSGTAVPLRVPWRWGCDRLSVVLNGVSIVGAYCCFRVSGFFFLFRGRCHCHRLRFKFLPTPICFHSHFPPRRTDEVPLVGRGCASFFSYLGAALAVVLYVLLLSSSLCIWLLRRSPSCFLGMLSSLGFLRLPLCTRGSLEGAPLYLSFLGLIFFRCVSSSASVGPRFLPTVPACFPSVRALQRSTNHTSRLPRAPPALPLYTSHLRLYFVFLLFN